MKTKKILAGILCAGFCLSSMTACTGNGGNADGQGSEATAAQAKTEQLHKLTVRAPKKNSEITATFMNTSNGKTEDIEMEIDSEEENTVILTCEADVNKYNMVHLSYGTTTSMDVAFNTFVSGWNLDNDELLPYAVGTQPVYDPKFDTKVFQFDGRDKNVYIWTPEDYDEKSEDKYSVIYMFDGQSVLATGKDRGMDNDVLCWNVSENVEGMMAATDNKAILVCIDNGSPHRSDELVPDIGQINMEEDGPNVKEEDISLKRGSAFADFICDTIMPYINQNYNVYTDAQHTSLAGSSLGGLETFYTVLTHPDKFGTGGIMSATFGMFAEKEWTEFLKDKYNMDNAPFLYIYAGGYSTDNGEPTEMMYNKLIDNGYPKDRFIFSKYEPGAHFMQYWRNIYPEFLEAAFTQTVTALEFGVPVHYEDKSNPYEEYLKEMELDAENDKPGYVYYDNSETKWDKGTDIYRIVAPFGAQGIIFDSGVTDKEVSAGKDAYQTTDLPYTNALIGKLYKIDTSVEPKADPGSMKTKRRYSEGSWSDYSENN